MAVSIAAAGILLAFAAPVVVSSAPITHVTVYSDRAQVTRTADVPLAGGEAQSFVLPLLLDSIDSASVRVAATGGDVERVDITYVPASDFPRDRARKLLEEIETLDASIDRLGRERAVWQSLNESARALRPTLPSDTMRPLPKVNPIGWGAATALLRSNAERAQKKVIAIDLELRKLGKKRRPLVEEAQKLGSMQPRSGYKVTALVRGKGTAHLQMSYMVERARWLPSYDIQLQPSTGKVQLQFAAAVSQESGEDWTDAKLTLSTAVPATATRYPKVPTWTIGERERFIPTPRPVSESYPPAPASRPLPRPPNDDDLLRSQLQRYASGGRYAPSGGLTAIAGDEGGSFGQAYARSRSEEQKTVEAEAPPPPAPPPPPEPEPRDAPLEITMAAKPMAKMDYARDEAKEYKRKSSRGPAPANPAPAGQPAPEVSEALGLLPAGGWIAPSYASNLPVSLAGGNDLTFNSIATETVQSGKGARRVALLSRTWPVTVERKLFPALAPDAYLVAELKSPEKDPLPGGEANLFVGADPAGVASLGLIAPGEAFTLPLGLDRALRPVRNVKVNTIEKGVINKDEISEYVTTIEIVNPYRTTVAVRILDQYPITQNKQMEIKLTRTEPAPAATDTYKGQLEWRLNLAPGQKQVLTFVYTWKRPKGFRLYQ